MAPDKKPRGRILLVEDDPHVAMPLADTLRLDGYDVIIAPDSRSGLEAAQRERPDLVLLDRILPDREGLEVCRELRAQGNTLTIVVLTGLDSAASRLESIRAGADDFITKGEEPELLLAKVESVMRLVEARREIESLRQKVTSRIVHELRTPVQVISGLAELIQDQITDERVSEFLRMIRAQSARLGDLVDSILQASKMVSENLTLERKTQDLRELAAELTEEMQILAADKRIRIALSCEGDTVLSFDRKLMGSALRNLISNAIKYGATGCTVSVRLESAEKALRIEVADDGPGVTQQELELLFTPFYRTLAARESRQPGSGLGLVIVQHIAAAHGGSIRASRVEPHGLRFVIALPK